MTAFNVAGLLREPAGAVREYRLRDRYLSLAPDVELAGPINGRLRMQRTNRGILVRGEVDGDLRRTCGRCLDAYVEVAVVQISEEYVPSIDPESGTALPEPASDESARLIDGHHELDLTPVLREEFSLTEPLHPVCRPDCPGLCAECGERLDDAHVAHASEEVDPRLAGLARFLERDAD